MGNVKQETGAASLLIGDSWESTGSSVEVLNPATGEVLGKQAVASADATVRATTSASAAFKRWSATSPYVRADLLSQIAQRLLEQAQPIADILSRETGKLLDEALGEVRLSADYFSWFAGEARRLEELSVVDGRAAGPQAVFNKPAGIAAVLTPWNFPVSLQARKLAPALTAGCSVVARPSDQAPLSVVELFECIRQCAENVGAPEGLINLLTGPASEISAQLMESPEVRVVSFTGSTGIGKSLYAQGSKTMKRLALELGGCAPFIVLDDADLQSTLKQAYLAKFRNGGQSCVAANAFYVHEDLYEDFVSGLSEHVASLRLGEQTDRETTMGPLINANHASQIAALSQEAVSSGFDSVTRTPEVQSSTSDVRTLSHDSFYSPEVLAAPDIREVSSEFLLKELFGPLAPVVGYRDLEDVLNLQKQNPLGLAGYVFSGSTSRAMNVAAGLDVGIAGANEGLATATNVPMGGVKESGLGREGGHIGLEEFLEPQYIAVRGPSFSSWALER